MTGASWDAHCRSTSVVAVVARDASAPGVSATLGDELDAVFGANHPPERAKLLSDFARALLRRAVLTDRERDVTTLAAEVVSMLDFVAGRGDAPLAVRVFNPDPTIHGYASPGAVVELNVPDAPFLVESVSAELRARGLDPLRVLHPVIGTVREAGRLISIGSVRGAPSCESVQHYQLDRPLTADEIAAIESALRNVISDVQAAVRDFDAMKASIETMVEATRAGASHYSHDEVEEAVAFLRWLLDDNFVFLGFREYRIVAGSEGRSLQVVPKSGLGILSVTDGSRFAQPVPLRDLPPNQLERYLSGHLLVVSKTNRTATVHRRARMDYIGVRRMDADGRVAGEVRLIGLFTTKAFMMRSSSLPLLRRKLEWIVESEDLIEGSHDHRAVVEIFDSFPKEELFSVPREELARSMSGLLALEEQRGVRLFVRTDLLGRNVSVLVAMPRDRFNATLRRNLQALFLERFNGTAVDYRLALGENDPARIHFTVWVDADQVPEVSFSVLEAEVADLTRTWDDRLADRLAVDHGQDRAAALAGRWAGRFPEYYKSSTSLDVAAGDIAALHRLVSGDSPLVVGLQTEPPGAEQLTRLSFYHLGEKLALSDMMPLLEDLGLQVIEEVPTRLVAEGPPILIHDFGVRGPDGAPLDLAETGDRIEALITAAWRGEAESDSLSRLIIAAGLSHDDVAVLRAYKTYWRRVSPQFTVAYIHDTLVRHSHIAVGLVRMFRARFAPGGTDDEAALARAEVLAGVDAVESLDEDRILRAMAELVCATVRTNAYRPNRSCLAFKLRSAEVPGMPRPYPLYEVFVYGPHVEGIHLRGGMVARGGIRWSERREDYRTEVLGLMKAQMTKNAVIVPTGAKGGFVLRGGEGGDVRPAVRAAYETLIRGLLEVTDNLVDGALVHPAGVRVHDEPDPYLVVAADKGTATFSDVANGLAAEYGFWLGDAFASGGSAGYDHKALAITARGAWESVKHHFHEMGRNAATEPLTAVGIGDMSGDVFGNGMLLAPQLRLVAAFDHRHIFLDPHPDPTRGYAERRRLFATPGSSWDDYDRSAISTGGGVYPRSAKKVELSPEAAAALGAEPGPLTPSELIRTILTAPVDLLWNGGIGTYVKAADESHAEVGDRSNDAVRIDGRMLRCRVVAEGGNLGLTQLGRIEYARNGGRIYADFIDNSGGVHCSDREVNLKVLLGLAIDRGVLDGAERDGLIGALSGDITAKVVYENFLQAQILSQEQAASINRLDAYEDLMQSLEQSGVLDRTIEMLPSTEDMVERGRVGLGMTTPELAVLLAYAKRMLSEELLGSDLPDAPEFQRDLATYFPDEVVRRFGSLLPEHPLRRELIATVVANEVIDSEGITFVARLTAETGSPAPAIVRAFRIAREVTGAVAWWDAIERIEGQIDPAIQHDLLAGVDALVEATARWHLGHGETQLPAQTIAANRDAFVALSDALPEIGTPEWVAAREQRVGELIGAGVPEELARRHAYADALVYAPDIIELARRHEAALDAMGRLSFLVAETFQLDRLTGILEQPSRSSRWQRSAGGAVADDLLALRRHLTERVAEQAGGLDPAGAVAAYVAACGDRFNQLTRVLRSVAVEGGDDVASVVVAVRRIQRLVG